MLVSMLGIKLSYSLLCKEEPLGQTLQMSVTFAPACLFSPAVSSWAPDSQSVPSGQLAGRRAPWDIDNMSCAESLLWICSGGRKGCLGDPEHCLQ